MEQQEGSTLFITDTKVENSGAVPESETAKENQEAEEKVENQENIEKESEEKTEDQKPSEEIRENVNKIFDQPKAENETENPKEEKTPEPAVEEKIVKSPAKKVEEKKNAPEKNKIPKDELRDIVNKLLSGTSPSEFSSDVLEQTIDVLKEDKQECIQKKKYIDAQKITKVTKKVQQEISKSSFNEHYETKIQQLEKKRDEAQKDFDNLNQKWQQKMDEFSAVVQEKVDKLCKQNDEQLAKFDEQVDKEISNTVIRGTRELNDMKSKEDGLVSNDMFIEAAAIRAKIDKLEQEMLENEKLKKRGEADMRRRNIIEQQFNQLKVIEQWSNEKSIDLSRQMASELEAAQNRIRNFNNLIEDARKNAENPTAEKMASVKTKAIAKRNGAVVVPSVPGRKTPKRSSSRSIKM